MALKRKRTPQLEPTTYDTVWPGDDAVDLTSPQTDLDQYCRSLGDPAFLSIRPGMIPARITYRALTQRELDATAGAREMAPYEAFRYGIVSIAGERLLRTKHRGIQGLTDGCLDGICEIETELPWYHAINTMAREAGDTSETERVPTIRVPLPVFVGTLIQGATFRERKR